jgi:DNA-binding NarL/FixJ family response regulator
VSSGSAEVGRAGEDAPITIVIADDHRVVRAGLKMLLDAQDGFQVVSEAGDIALTERRIAAYRPRVLVLDANMPEMPICQRAPACLRSRGSVTPHRRPVSSS